LTLPPNKPEIERDPVIMQKTMSSIIITIACAANISFACAEDLLSVYQQAKANDPVLLKTEAQYMAAKEDIIQTRSYLLPSLTGSAQRRQIAGSPKNTYESSFGLEFSMSLYDHTYWLNLGKAKKLAHRSDVIYQAAKQELIVRVTQAYFNVLRAKDDLEFTNTEKTAIERQLEQTKQRYSVGLTAVTDVHEAQAQYDNAVTAEIRAQNSVFNAQEALRVITNVYPRDLHVLNTERFSASRPSPDSANEWQQTAEAKNLDLISQKISVDVAKEDINLASAGHYPTLSFSGNYGGNEFEDITNKNSLGIRLSVPIYSGGRTSSRVRQQQSNYVAASQDLQQTHRNIVRNARNAYNTVITAVSGIKALEQALISADSALKATEAGFEVGTRTIVDVLDSTRNLFNAKRNLSSTRYDYVQAILALKRAGGTISEQDIENINKGLSPAK
jgi:outer membrane protein